MVRKEKESTAPVVFFDIGDILSTPRLSHVSENMFTGPQLGLTKTEPNPNYSTEANIIIDSDYAADITRAVVATL